MLPVRRGMAGKMEPHYLYQEHYASPFKLTGSRGFSLGYYKGGKNGGFYFTAKKGKGVMLSLLLHG